MRGVINSTFFKFSFGFLAIVFLSFVMVNVLIGPHSKAAPVEQASPRQQ